MVELEAWMARHSEGEVVSKESLQVVLDTDSIKVLSARDFLELGFGHFEVVVSVLFSISFKKTAAHVIDQKCSVLGLFFSHFNENVKGLAKTAKRIFEVSSAEQVIS